MENKTSADNQDQEKKERKKYTRKMVEFFCPDCERTLVLPTGFRIRCPDCAKQFEKENARRNSKKRSDENKIQADINRKLKEKPMTPAASFRAEIEKMEREEAKKLAIQQKQCVLCGYSSKCSSTVICNCLLITGVRAGKEEPGKCRSFTPRAKMTPAQRKAQQRKQLEMVDAELAAESRANEEINTHQPLY